MGFTEDQRDQIQRAGYSGGLLPPNIQAQLTAAANSFTAKDGKLGILDPAVDLEWAHAYKNRPPIHTYFDYFFTGQDIRVFVDGVYDGDPDSDLNIMSFAFNVSQQKQPVYGFWDYTYSAMLRGTRVVNGQFTIATTSTDYMTRLISKAADARSQQNQLFILAEEDNDEANIAKYWSRNMNDDTLLSNGKNLFSTHPPFNLIIVYGIQSSSITGDGSAKLSEALARYRNDNSPLVTDVNERLVVTNPDNAMRYVLESVELTSVQVEYAPDGRVCGETYSFIARDYLTPRQDHNYNKPDPSELPSQPSHAN